MEDGLAIRTFGGLSIKVGDREITGFASRKAEVLLVYLALQQRAIAREALAELLWEDRTQTQAQANLRVVLSSLKKHLGKYLDIDRYYIGYAQSAPLWVDALYLQGALDKFPDQASTVSPEAVETLKQVLDLYQGEFLESVYVQDAPDLGAWIERERRYLHGLAVRGLGYLAGICLETEEYERGVAYTARLVDLDPLAESGQRLYMRLLALNGQRSAALAQYERLKLHLAQELGVEPEAETNRLFHQIQSGELLSLRNRKQVLPVPRLRFPAYLQVEKAVEGPPVFVGREEQLQKLDAALNEAISGTGQLFFIVGSPGQGKSMLMQQFARRAAAAHPDLLVAMGSCSALSSAGDSYLPFRDILGMLTGDLEGKLVSEAITHQQARMLWQALPTVIDALKEHGANLVGLFVQGKDLFSCLAGALEGQPGELERLAWLKESRLPTPGEVETAALFEEYLQVLCAISSEQPLLLVVDDLQWADEASTNLLFHLGRRISSGRILLLAAYREEELASPAGGKREALPKALAEFKRQYGDIWIDLGAIPESQGREFIDQYLDTEPNHLDEHFRQALFEHTGGHPLFTVELCRSLQDRGMLSREAGEYWQAAADLDWKALPARVEGVIEGRLGYLDDAQRAILDTAAVEGDEFTAQVIAQVCGVEERKIARQLSGEMSQTHRLVNESRVTRVGERPLYRFRFRHSLYREYIYQRLGEVNRSLLHGEVAAALESLYGDQANEIAPLLGWHYSESGDIQKAIPYLLLAGDQARLRFAYPEAIQHYQRAISWLNECGEYGEAARTLMKLGLAYHTNLEFDSSREAYAEGFALWQRHNRESSAVPISPAPHALREERWVLPSLDRIRYNTTSVGLISYQIYSGLVAHDLGLGVIPDGAASWEIMDSGRRYIFHLREDSTWSDGVPVSAGDYVCAWKRVLDPEAKSDSASNLFDLRGAREYYDGRGSPEALGVRAIDQFTLALELEKPAGYFLHLLADSCLFPIPKHIWMDDRENWQQPGVILSNGPFSVEAWSPGSKLVLSRNPSYHGQFTGNLERVELIVSQDVYNSLNHYKADLVDVYDISALNPGDILDQQRQHPGEYIEYPSGVSLLAFNLERLPFKDLRIRQAFAHAINKDMLVKQCSPQGSPALGGLVPPDMPGHSPTIGYGYDPIRAQQLLADAGYAGGKGFPDVTILEADFPIYRRIIQTLCQQWLETLGIEVKQKYVKFKHYRTWFDESYDIGSMSIYADYPDCDWYLRSFIGSSAPFRNAWQSDAYNQSVLRASQELDQQKRLVYYEQADKLLIDEAVAIPIIYTVSSYLIKPWVKRFPYSMVGLEHWKDVVIEPH